MESPRLKQIKAFLEENPEDAFLTFALAKEYEGIGHEEKALATYLELCQKHPDYVGTYYHLGKLYERKESFSEAFETYREGMRIAKAAEDRHALNELAGAKLNLGDDEDFE